jgi:hypothetical protein
LVCAQRNGTIVPKKSVLSGPWYSAVGSVGVVVGVAVGPGATGVVGVVVGVVGVASAVGAADVAGVVGVVVMGSAGAAGVVGATGATRVVVGVVVGVVAGVVVGATVVGVVVVGATAAPGETVEPVGPGPTDAESAGADA